MTIAVDMGRKATKNKKQKKKKPIKFGEILSICSQQNIERKQNFGVNQGP